MITISEPVYFRDQFIGVAAIDIGLEAMRRVLAVGDCIGESILIDENKKIIAKESWIDMNDSTIQLPDGPSENFF